MLKVVKAKKYWIRRKIRIKGSQISPEWQLWFLDILSKNQFWWIIIHFHPCNPLLLFQNTCSILSCGIFLSNLFVYLVASGNAMWILGNRNFYNQPCQCPFNCASGQMTHTAPPFFSSPPLRRVSPKIKFASIHLYSWCTGIIVLQIVSERWKRVHNIHTFTKVIVADVLKKDIPGQFFSDQFIVS